VYRFFTELENITDGTEDKEVEKLLHQTIQKVEFDIEHLKFNTGISALMIFNNLAIKKGTVTKKTAEIFAKILSPYSPHVAEELWSMYGNTNTLAYEPWPEVDLSLLVEDTFEYPVSFNGKTRYMKGLPVDMPVAEIEKEVLADDRTAKWLEGKGVKKMIIVQNRIINVVVG
jgi:leucyl-tRNA synthetase